jgi:hypothetical protein
MIRDRFYNFGDRSMTAFLPDGGIALRAGKVRLPPHIFFSADTVLSQPLMKWEAGKTLVSVELFGYLFSFIIAMTDDELRAHFERTPILHITRCYSEGLQTASTGERFRPIHCSIV